MTDTSNPEHDQTTPADGDTSSAGVSRARARTSKPKAGATRQRKGPRSLIETAGPSPDDSLASIKLTVGVIGGTHGVHGELKLKLLTDHPEHLPTIRTVYLGESDEPTKVTGFRFHGDQGLITLEGVDNPEDGKRLGGLKVRILGSDAAPLEEGEYFLFQLIGLRAETESGESVGVVTDLLETGAHDVLVIRPESGDEILVPNHPEYVRNILPDEGRIVIVPPVYLN